MTQMPHVEKHFTSSKAVRDIVLGMADGLTVPFALAAGLTGAVNGNAIIVTAGLAEIAAGSISMGLGGYLAAKSEIEHYASERTREQREVVELPHREKEEVADVFRTYGLTDDEIAPVLTAFEKRPHDWVDFMMRFELGLEKPDPRRSLTSALMIATAYMIGGLIPLSPYITLDDPRPSLIISSIITLAALLIFGYVKGRFTGVKPIRSGLQTALVGGLAAAAAFVIAKLLSPAL